MFLGIFPHLYLLSKISLYKTLKFSHTLLEYQYTFGLSVEAELATRLGTLH
jgi:hypothetical protein